MTRYKYHGNRQNHSIALAVYTKNRLQLKSSITEWECRDISTEEILKNTAALPDEQHK